MAQAQFHSHATPPNLTPQTLRLCFLPPPELKKQIVQCLYRRRAHEANLNDYTNYFDFYEHTCKALYLGVRREADTLASQTHEHILDIINIIYSLTTSKVNFRRKTLRELCRDTVDVSRSDANINASIDLALRLWLTIGIKRHEATQMPSNALWNDDQSLHDFVRYQFPGPVTAGGPSVVLGNELRAVNLERLSGISIIWTYSIEDHLLFDKDDRTLRVYMLKQVLQDHMLRQVLRPQLAPSQSTDVQIGSQIGIFPTDLVKEVLLSLHLLFPNWDLETERYLQKADRTFITEMDLDTPRRLFLADFHYWHDRIANLITESHSLPTSWKQLWTDRRNPLQFYTFWFAVIILILTVVFGIISSVTACMQTRYSYLTLQLARAAAEATMTCAPVAP